MEIQPAQPVCNVILSPNNAVQFPQNDVCPLAVAVDHHAFKPWYVFPQKPDQLVFFVYAIPVDHHSSHCLSGGFRLPEIKVAQTPLAGRFLIGFIAAQRNPGAEGFHCSLERRRL